MKHRVSISISIFLTMLILAAYYLTHRFGIAPSLYEIVERPSGLPTLGKAVSSEAIVQLIPAEFKKYARPRKTISLDLFGKKAEYELTKVYDNSQDGLFLVGRAKDDRLSGLFISMNAGFAFGRIEHKGAIYEIVPSPDSPLHRLVLVDNNKLGSLKDDVVDLSSFRANTLRRSPKAVHKPNRTIDTRPANLAHDSPGSADIEVPPTGFDCGPSYKGDDGSVIDILVLYTTGLAEEYPGTQLDLLMQHLVNMSNESYSSSNIPMRINIVHAHQVEYSDGIRLNDTLYQFYSGLDVFSDVADLRNQFNADIAMLLMKGTSIFDLCGLSTQPHPLVSTRYARFAYGVARIGAGCPLTFTHELGHIMGSDHQHGAAWGEGMFPYSRGYQVRDDGDNVISSIMAVGGYRKTWFSNPSIGWGFGGSMGVPEGMVDAADNAKSIRNMRTHIARYRNSIDVGNDHSDSLFVKVGESVYSTISSANDEDVFMFYAEQGKIYSIEIVRIPNEIQDISIALLNSDGITAIGHDDNLPDNNPRITWTSPATGNYFVRVKGENGKLGAYYLSLDSTNAPEDHGDTALEGTKIGIGSTVTGCLGTAGDEDWFILNTHCSQTVNGVDVTFNFTGWDSSTIAELYDNSLTLVSDYLTDFHWNCTGDQNYFIRVYTDSDITNFRLSVSAPP